MVYTGVVPRGQSRSQKADPIQGSGLETAVNSYTRSQSVDQELTVKLCSELKSGTSSHAKGHSWSQELIANLRIRARIRNQ